MPRCIAVIEEAFNAGSAKGIWLNKNSGYIELRLSKFLVYLNQNLSCYTHTHTHTHSFIAKCIWIASLLDLNIYSFPRIAYFMVRYRYTLSETLCLASDTHLPLFLNITDLGANYQTVLRRRKFVNYDVFLSASNKIIIFLISIRGG